VIAVDAAEVDASERLRPIDAAWATALGQIMLAEGQQTPILVCRHAKEKPWRLIAGGHRHAAAEMFLDLNPLWAIELEESALALRQAEIAENLWRRELAPIDRANFVAEMHEVLRARTGLDESLGRHAIAAHVRWKKNLRQIAQDASVKITDAYGFTGHIADLAGLSKSSIEKDLMLARRLSPLVAERLRSHPVAGNATQLRALAKLDQHEQAAVVRCLLFGAKSVSEALAQLSDKPKLSVEDKRYSTIIGTLQRMSVTERLGLFQTPAFHALIPAEARRLLAPMLRGGSDATYLENSNAAIDSPPDQDREAARLAGHGGSPRALGSHEGSERRNRRVDGGSELLHYQAVAGQARGASGAADELSAGIVAADLTPRGAA